MAKVSADQAQQAIAAILRYGSLISTLIMGLGVAVLLVRGAPVPTAGGKGLHAGALLGKLLRLDPTALMESGILVLLLTPVFRIIVAAVSFALERQPKYVFISLGVLAIVLLSIGFAIEA